MKLNQKFNVFQRIIITGLIFLVFTFSLTSFVSSGIQQNDNQGGQTLSPNMTSLIGGIGQDDAYNIVFDEENNIYLAGSTKSTDFPILNGFTTENPSLNGLRSGFVAKFSPEGELLGSTFLGGTNSDTIHGLALDKSKNIVVSGDTLSNDFQTTSDAFNTTYGGGSTPNVFTNGVDFCCADGFVSIISSDFSTLKYSSYIGGSDTEGHIQSVLDSQDRIIVIGWTTSQDFPTTSNAQQSNLNGGTDIFVSVFSQNGSKLLYSTFIGGSDDEFISLAKDIIVDSSNNIYITGGTKSSNFPITIDNSNIKSPGFWDSFLLKLTPDEYQLNSSITFGGTKTDFGTALVLDRDNNIFLTGTTDSTDFPISDNAFQSENNGGSCFFGGIPFCGDVFIMKVRPNFEFSYSTYFGGNKIDLASSIAILDNTKLIVSGDTNSDQNFPIVNPFQGTYQGGQFDGFVLAFSLINNKIISSTYLGGEYRDFLNPMRINSQGNIYVTGYTNSLDVVTTDGSTQHGSTDILLVRFTLSNFVENTSTTTSTVISTTTTIGFGLRK